jgi:hypothetical protein
MSHARHAPDAPGFRYSEDTMRLVPVIVVLTALSAGCAVGQTISYHEAKPALLARAPMPLAVVVQDQRPEVLNLKKAPQFVGLMRGGYGNPFDVQTTSGNPLADDVTFVIARGLAPGGFGVKPYPASGLNTPAQIVAGLATTGLSRVLLIQLGHFKSDTYSTTTLGVDVTARVLEVPTGRELGSSRVAGARNLGSSFWDPPAHAKHVLPPALRETLEQLLNAPQIVNALSLTIAPPAVAAPGMPPPGAASAPAPGAAPAAPYEAPGTAPGVR